MAMEVGACALWRIARESSAVPCMCIYMLHASTAVLGRTAVLFYMYAIQVTACRTPDRLSGSTVYPRQLVASGSAVLSVDHTVLARDTTLSASRSV